MDIPRFLTAPDVIMDDEEAQLPTVNPEMAYKEENKADLEPKTEAIGQQNVDMTDENEVHPSAKEPGSRTDTESRIFGSGITRITSKGLAKVKKEQFNRINRQSTQCKPSVVDPSKPNS